PEAVYEALYSCIEFYDWRKTAEKKIILIGDAQPHPKPRGIKKISKEDVILLAKDKSIIVDCIILPENKGK
ncbi:MAG: VWA domain-containing protein, partial [Spirochaetia bacterium]|nr:VWA domain-containing protein [Spirochaetia bacterium]